MKALFWIMALSILGNLTKANESGHQEKLFCKNHENPDFLYNQVLNPYNLMSYPNYGGILNQGVCWWHSRFQRNALYLTIFKPDLPKPDQNQIKKIIKDIRSGNKVVIIPGFANFYAFSLYNYSFIQNELDKWQKNDGILKFGWITGLKGKSVQSPERLKEIMDETYEEVTNNGIAYHKLQLPGIVAHAWLVVHMLPTDDGYELKVLDSNFPQYPMTYHYHQGDTSITYSHKKEWKFVPYLERTNEMQKINETIKNYCMGYHF